MERQDCGWAPMGGGGISLVELKKVYSRDDLYEYIVESCSPRNSIKFRCPLGSATRYYRPTPTFHFWQSEDQRFGLTFNSASQAEGFDRAFTRVIQGLSQDTGIHCPTDEAGSHTGGGVQEGGGCCVGGRAGGFPVSSTPGHSICSAQSWDSSAYHRWRTLAATTGGGVGSGGGVCVDPDSSYTSILGGGFRGSDQPKATVTSAPCVFSLLNQPPSEPLSRSSRLGQWISRSLLHTRKSNNNNGAYGAEISTHSTSSTNRATPRESYCTSISGAGSHSMLSSILRSPPSSSSTGHHHQQHHQRQRTLVCVYCRRRFQQKNNPPGSCSLAPDRGSTLVEQLACLPCAQALFRSCVCSGESEEVGGAGDPRARGDNSRNFIHRACLGELEDDIRHSTAEEGDQKTKKRSGQGCGQRGWRWTLLALISCLVPCLCCYRPMLACHQSCLGCGCLAGKHSAKHIVP